MLKILKITKSAEFRGNFSKFHAKNLILLTRPTAKQYLFNQKTGQNAQDFCRLGLTASKKVGNAIKRNRAKRQLREAATKIMPNFGKNEHDYVIIAKNTIKDVGFDDILRDLEFCLRRIHGKR